MDHFREFRDLRWLAALLVLLAAGCQTPLATDLSDDLFAGSQRALNTSDIPADSSGGVLGLITGENPEEIAPQLPDEIEFRNPELSSAPPDVDAAPPRTSIDTIPDEYWDMSIDEALQIGLAQATVMRNLGGRVLNNPDAEPTIYEPAIIEADPIFGEQAALSQFDTVLNGAMNFAKNDNVFNNSLAGGGAREVLQDLFTWNWSVDKTAATGTRFTLANSMQHESTSEPNLLVQFNHFWTVSTEATIRQPLMQGRGVDFNRIVGPNAQPGFRTTTGILLARINEDISITQFEAGVRTYVQEVLSAYWDLNFAYRNYDSAKTARQTALDTWQMIKARFDNNLPGGEADKEAQTRELYYLFDLQVEQALNGDPRRGITGVFQAEANLRRLLGLPQSDKRFIRPIDEPIDAKLTFDWSQLVEFAIERRVELRSQRWRIKRRELELIAAKNFLMPRLDGVVRYRNNGFGDDLTGGGSERFSSAAKDYFKGDHQEWEAGFQLNAPLGFRQGHAAVRNAELSLMRDRAVLDEQQKHIIFALGNAVRQLEQGYSSMQLAYNRLLAAQETVDARLATFESEAKAANELLDAQQRLADAQTEFYRAQSDYARAQIAVQDESGMLLDEYGLELNEEDGEFCGTNDVPYCWTRSPGEILNYCLSR